MASPSASTFQVVMESFKKSTPVVGAWVGFAAVIVACTIYVERGKAEVARLRSEMELKVKQQEKMEKLKEKLEEDREARLRSEMELKEKQEEERQARLRSEMELKEKQEEEREKLKAKLHERDMQLQAKEMETSRARSLVDTWDALVRTGLSADYPFKKNATDQASQLPSVQTTK